MFSVFVQNDCPKQKQTPSPSQHKPSYDSMVFTSVSLFWNSAKLTFDIFKTMAFWGFLTKLKKKKKKNVQGRGRR